MLHNSGPGLPTVGIYFLALFILRFGLDQRYLVGVYPARPISFAFRCTVERMVFDFAYYVSALL
jgi:hypothetical protein